MFKTHFDWLSIDSKSIAVDFCGRFENFESDFNIICHQIGVKKDIPHINKIANDPVNYKDFYNRNSRDIVEEYFKKDLDIFNYSY
jgi:hypothetical protein